MQFHYVTAQFEPFKFLSLWIYWFIYEVFLEILWLSYLGSFIQINLHSIEDAYFFQSTHVQFAGN